MNDTKGGESLDGLKSTDCGLEHKALTPDFPPVLSNRFPPACRVRKTDEYSSVFAFRRSIRGRYFVLHYRPGVELARLGFVVARKLARQAVTRNLLKRLAREHFRHIRATLPAHDMALRLAQKVDGATRAQLREDIASLFARLPR
ncbi:MAG: rnpA [Rhodocyclales bacterium]|nr:rnpA [Rhodocyclales bacterium]